jgi:hypothetical protein
MVALVRLVDNLLNALSLAWMAVKSIFLLILVQSSRLQMQPGIVAFAASMMALLRDLMCVGSR